MKTFLLISGICILMGSILCSLGVGLFYLVRDPKDNTHTVRALSFRIILSFILFIALLFAFLMGWINPHGMYA